MRRNSPILALVVAAVGFATAYLLWPRGALSTPESRMSVFEALRVFAALLSGSVVGLGGLISAVKRAKRSR
ncbi:MAG TPA: hypothetical protein VE935_13460 [Burkholderiales bacterium]|jgi:hypothetical protein|nr:hypothetical protein [Burkholderiales bacterium]